MPLFFPFSSSCFVSCFRSDCQTHTMVFRSGKLYEGKHSHIKQGRERERNPTLRGSKAQREDTSARECV